MAIRSWGFQWLGGKQVESVLRVFLDRNACFKGVFGEKCVFLGVFG